MVDRLRNIEERTEKDIVDCTNRLPDVVLGELDKGVVCRGGGSGSLRRVERCQVSMRLGQSMTSPQASDLNIHTLYIVPTKARGPK